ncbi:MAG: class I SAM-dependent methyltransferase [Promicromonosporaceae bacterium]|nr:class I SAM-dependent methyltransferase [Promicromonosporaceae bacterium]
MNLATLEKLLAPVGQALLASLPDYDDSQALSLARRLRAEGVDAELAAAAITQTRLRAAARGKFGDRAAGLLFTQAGLEQATRPPVAELHAARYLAAGVTKVADLTCGLGADSLALATAGRRVLATDLDPITAALAAVNLRPLPGVEVRCADGLGLDLAAEGVDGVSADPARRTATGRRVFDPADYRPPLDAIWSLRSTVPAVGIKVGPGIPHDGLPPDAEVQWVSVDSTVVEAGLWFGPLAPDGPGNTCLLLRQTSGRPAARALRGTGATVEAGPVGAYLFEPDGAVIRAGLVAEAAAELGGHLLDPTIAYVTADSFTAIAPEQVPLASAYRVQDVLPLKVKALKGYLRERQVGRVTIKKRGTSLTPEQLRPQLALQGPNEATIVLTRIAGRHSALVVEPLEAHRFEGH